MSTWFDNTSLLLADSRLEQFGSRFRGKGADLNTNDYIILATIVLAVPLGIWLLSRFSRLKSAKTNSPMDLFHQLCAAHKLQRADKKLLRRLAKWQRLTQPAKLFLEPARYFATNLGPDLQAKQEKFSTLRQRIFESLGEDSK